MIQDDDDNADKRILDIVIFIVTGTARSSSFRKRLAEDGPVCGGVASGSSTMYDSTSSVVAEVVRARVRPSVVLLLEVVQGKEEAIVHDT